MQETPKNYTWLLIYSSMLHFLVDGLCVCCLYLMVPYMNVTQVVGIFLAYNVLAFMTQPFTGVSADKCHRQYLLLLFALIFLGLAVLLAAWVHDAERVSTSTKVVWGVAALLGMGNSCFHVWGGKLTAKRTDNDMRCLGVFVSTGALGLSVGLVYCSWTLLFAFLLLMILLSISCRRHDGEEDRKSEKNIQQEQKPPQWHIVVIGVSLVALVLFVMCRSYVGELFTRGINKTHTLVLIIGTTSMLGKMAGGWVARQFGIIKSMALVLLAAAVCLIGRHDSMVLLLLGIFAINLTMPVTLYLANVVLREKEGLAFGLLAAALIPGYLLAIW